MRNYARTTWLGVATLGALLLLLPPLPLVQGDGQCRENCPCSEEALKKGMVDTEKGCVKGDQGALGPTDKATRDLLTRLAKKMDKNTDDALTIALRAYQEAELPQAQRCPAGSMSIYRDAWREWLRDTVKPPQDFGGQTEAENINKLISNAVRKKAHSLGVELLPLGV